MIRKELDIIQQNLRYIVQTAMDAQAMYVDTKPERYVRVVEDAPKTLGWIEKAARASLALIEE